MGLSSDGMPDLAVTGPSWLSRSDGAPQRRRRVPD